MCHYAGSHLGTYCAKSPWNGTSRMSWAGHIWLAQPSIDGGTGSEGMPAEICAPYFESSPQPVPAIPP